MVVSMQLGAFFIRPELMEKTLSVSMLIGLGLVICSVMFLLRSAMGKQQSFVAMAIIGFALTSMFVSVASIGREQQLIEKEQMAGQQAIIRELHELRAIIDHTSQQRRR